MLISSILLCSVLFHEPASTFIVIGKVVLIYCLCLICLRDRGDTVLLMADLSIIFLILIGLLTELGFVDSQISENQVWRKNNIGFLNPNIGPCFAFSALFVYFIFGKWKRFLFVIMLLLIGWYELNAFSRTYCAGAIILTAYPIFRAMKLEEIFSRTLMVSSLAATFLFGLLASLLVSDLIELEGWLVSFDNILSARLLKISEIQLSTIGAGWGMYIINSIDSIYYELLIIFGPYSIFKWIDGIRGIYLRPSQGSSAGVNLCGISVILTIGLFEGVFMKFSPMVVLIVMIVLGSLNELRDDLNEMKSCQLNLRT